METELISLEIMQIYLKNEEMDAKESIYCVRGWKFFR